MKTKQNSKKEEKTKKEIKTENKKVRKSVVKGNKKRKKKRRLKKCVIVLMIVLLILLLFSCSLFLLIKYDKDKKIEQARLEKKRIENKIKDISNHYGEYTVTNKLSNLYKLDNGKYVKSGEINEGVNVHLDSIEKIDENNDYFHISDLDLYVKYSDVDKSESIESDDQWKRYIPFNENIKTKDVVKFYDSDDKYLYTLDNSYDFKIIVKDDNRYGVEFNNELLYVHKDDVEKVYENHNTDEKGKSRVRTVIYHFLYNPEKTKCEGIYCQTLSQFESHIKYLYENNYFTLRMQDLELYIDGKINIPEKSVVITVDDGTTFDLDAIKLLEKYKVHATLFVITSWVPVTDELKSSKYLDLQSHTHNMHNQFECKGYGPSGGGILCLPEDRILEDLKTSQEKLGGNIYYFSYPFLEYNDRAIELLKKAGFRMAVTGEKSYDGFSYPNVTDKYKVGRLTLFARTTLDEFIWYLD